MFTSVLVPLDGSALSRKAVPYAAALAEQGHGRIIFFQAITSGARGAEVEDARDLRLDQEWGRGIKVETRTVRCEPGHVAAAILEAAKEAAADLIVMASHGRGELGRLVLGSVAERVLREAGVPVLLVTSRSERPWPTAKAPRVVVALDGSKLAETALAAARAVAGAPGGTIVLVEAVDLRAVAYANAYAYTESLLEGDVQRAQNYLQGVAGTLADAGAAVDVRVEAGIPDMAISDAAQDLDADLIVMATHGRGGIDRLFLGSVAFGVLHRARVPLLLVRPAAGAKDDLAPTAGDTSSLAVSHRELRILQAGLERVRLAPDENVATPEEVARLSERLRAVERAG